MNRRIPIRTRKAVVVRPQPKLCFGCPSLIRTGVRSRAAFVLLNLQKEFNFLQNRNCIVDLGAAPGGFLQVASAYAEEGSSIIGVDVLPIQPVKNCVTVQADITDPRCLALIKMAIRPWVAREVDLVLNETVVENVVQDGINDGYEQTCLALKAFKLATALLQSEGSFITKIVPSECYKAFVWLLKESFDAFYIYTMKYNDGPDEQYAVCWGYRGLFIHNNRLILKYLFTKLDCAEGLKFYWKSLAHYYTGAATKVDGLSPNGRLPSGPIAASDFVTNVEDFLDLLGNASYIIIDSEWIYFHPKTTNYIKACCNDVTVIGSPEIINLLEWREYLFNAIFEDAKQFGSIQEIEEALDASAEESVATEIKPEKASAQLKENELNEAKGTEENAMLERKNISETASAEMVISRGRGVGPTDTFDDNAETLVPNEDAENGSDEDPGRETDLGVNENESGLEDQDFAVDEEVAWPSQPLATENRRFYLKSPWYYLQQKMLKMLSRLDSEARTKKRNIIKIEVITITDELEEKKPKIDFIGLVPAATVVHPQETMPIFRKLRKPKNKVEAQIKKGGKSDSENVKQRKQVNGGTERSGLNKVAVVVPEIIDLTEDEPQVKVKSKAKGKGKGKSQRK